jgi:phospholipase/carboxylesterase
MLHGWGANAQDVSFLCSLLELPNCQFILPDAPLPHPYSIGGKMWYDLNENLTFRSDISQQQDLQTSRQLLQEWLRSLEATTGVPLSRTILGGFSQGGAMTLDVGLSLPLAGMMILSGYQHSPLVSQPKYPPILMVYGRQDPVVPLMAAHIARDNLASIEAPFQYKEFDMGHEISPLVLNEMQQFIEQIFGKN